MMSWIAPTCWLDPALLRDRCELACWWTTTGRQCGVCDPQHSRPHADSALRHIMEDPCRWHRIGHQDAARIQYLERLSLESSYHDRPAALRAAGQALLRMCHPQHPFRLGLHKMLAIAKANQNENSNASLFTGQY